MLLAVNSGREGRKALAAPVALFEAGCHSKAMIRYLSATIVLILASQRQDLTPLIAVVP